CCRACGNAFASSVRKSAKYDPDPPGEMGSDPVSKQKGPDLDEIWPLVNQRNELAQYPDDAEVQRRELVVDHADAGAVQVAGVGHLVLDAHQRAVELSLEADAKDRVRAIVLEGLTERRRYLGGGVEVFAEGRLALPVIDTGAAI